MALSLISKFDSNTMGNELRESILFILPIAFVVTLVSTIYMMFTGVTAPGTNDGSVLYMYYELFLATFGARNIETD